MTQIRYDDFALSEAATLYGSFPSYLGSILIQTLDLDRVEVLKNSAGSLYGSSATAGVISLFSGDKWNMGTELLAQTRYGSYGTWSVGGLAAYGDDKYYITFSPMFENSNGYLGNWHKRFGFNLGAGLRMQNGTSVEFVALGIYNKSLSLRNPYYNPKPDPLPDNNYLIHQFGLAGLTVNHTVSDRWDMRFKFSALYGKREYHGFLAEWGEDFFISKTFSFEWLNNLALNENLRLVVGLDGLGDKMSLEYPRAHDYYPFDPVNISYSSFNYSAFGKLLGSFFDDHLFFSAGGRINYTNIYGHYGTYDFSAAYNFGFGLTVYTSLSSGYQTPSGSQIINPWPMYGGTSNFDLLPEKSQGVELGLEQSLYDGKVFLGAAIFQTNYRDMINWPLGSYCYENIDQGRSRGFELSASLMPNRFFRADLAFSYTDAKFRRAGGIWERQFNIPEKLFSAGISVYPVEGLVLSAMAKWQSETRVQVFSDDWWELPYELVEKALFIVDLAASYDINQHIGVFAKVNNLFNNQYTVGGYAQPGINFQVGLQVRW